MNKMKTSLALVLLLALCGTTAAQSVQIGDPFPKIKIEEFTNTRAKSMNAFKGKLLLVEFFAFW